MLAVETAANVIRRARQTAGITQAELARRSGVAQPTISAYERGEHEPSFRTLQQLLACTGFTLQIAKTKQLRSRRLPSTPLGSKIHHKRHELIDAGKRLGATNLRLFGSVARGDDGVDSDIDILVDLAPTVSLLGLGELEETFSRILERDVEVVPASGLKSGLRGQVLEEAIPLEPA